MAETTWNFTIPDSSPLFSYEQFNQICPNIVNGQAQCDSSSYHESNGTTSTITLQFNGVGITLFGSVQTGTRYTLALDEESPVDGDPDGNVLGAFSNIPAAQPDDLGVGTHQLTLTATRYTDGSILTFTGAQVEVGTGLSGAHTTITNYSISNPLLNFTPGWTKNGSYLESGTEFPQTVSLSFNGSAVWIYGQCGSDIASNGISSSEFGQVQLDGGNLEQIEDSSNNWFFDGLPSYVVPNCLLYAASGLEEGPHNVSYQTDGDDVFIKQFQTLSVSGGGKRGASGSSASTSPGTLNPLSSFHMGPGIIAAIAGAVVLIALAALALFFYRRSKRRKTSSYPKPPTSSNSFTAGPYSNSTNPDITTASYATLPSTASIHGFSQYPPSPAPPVPSVPFAFQNHDYRSSNLSGVSTAPGFSTPDPFRGELIQPLPASSYPPTSEYASTPTSAVPFVNQSYPYTPEPSHSAHQSFGQSSAYPQSSSSGSGRQPIVMAAPMDPELLPPKMRQELQWSQNAQTTQSSSSVHSSAHHTPPSVNGAAGNQYGNPPSASGPMDSPERPAALRRLTLALEQQGADGAPGSREAMPPEDAPPDYAHAVSSRI